REDWGARVAKRIPRNVLLRPLAFLFYSGAAGGIAFGVLGAFLSTFGLAMWYLVVPSTWRGTANGEIVLAARLIAAYTYCYSLTAAVVRRLLANSTFPVGATWLVALILFGLGCTMPFLFSFAFIDNYSRRGFSDELMALYLPNPVVMIDEVVRRDANTP